MKVKKLMKAGLRYLSDRNYRFLIHADAGWYDYLSDEEYLKRKFRAKIGKQLNLENPKTFNEKLQWLKLFDQRPEYTMMVDKYAVKQYVAARIGQEYIIPTLGVWERFEDIDFESLPNQFVLKCTHDSGGLVICPDKTKLDKKAAEQKIGRSLKRNYYLRGREWPYKDVIPQIIAEQYMEDEKLQELRDYKFFCFDGKAKAVYIATDRQTAGEEVKFTFFDMEFRHLDFENSHHNAKILPEKPVCFEEMKRLAEKLSQGIPHVRVDFYEVNQSVFFGEMTFFHMSGMSAFKPEVWDEKFGSWIKLPEKQIL